MYFRVMDSNIEVGLQVADYLLQIKAIELKPQAPFTWASGLKSPTAEDAYAHLGVKIGGMSLDGEGASGMATMNAAKPWQETSLTLDGFAYHGLSKLDAGTSALAPPVPAGQNDSINAVGGFSIKINGTVQR